MIYKRVHDQKMQQAVRNFAWLSFPKSIVVDDDIMRDKRTVEVLGQDLILLNRS